MRKIKRKVALHPIMAYLLLICITIVISGILGFFEISTNYNVINAVRGNIESSTAAVRSLFNLSGLKLIFSETVSNFSSFAPLSMLIIILIGIIGKYIANIYSKVYITINTKIRKPLYGYLILIEKYL